MEQKETEANNISGIGLNYTSFSNDWWKKQGISSGVPY